MGFEVNGKKTNFMIVSQKPYTENEYVKTGTCNFEIVKHCTYLAKILTNKNELRPEIEKRITNVNTAYELRPLLKSQSVIRAEKIKICKTIIRPVATYRAESYEQHG
jgi:hypothetical protein